MIKDPVKKELFLTELYRLVDARDENTSIPVLGTMIHRAFDEIFGKKEDFTQIKHDYNQLVL